MKESFNPYREDKSQNEGPILTVSIENGVLVIRPAVKKEATKKEQPPKPNQELHKKNLSIFCGFRHGVYYVNGVPQTSPKNK